MAVATAAPVEESETNPSEEDNWNDLAQLAAAQCVDTNVESLPAAPSTAELANIEATEAAKVRNEKKVINVDIFHETGLESRITTTSSSISESYNENSQFTTTKITTVDSSGFTDIHENKETIVEENEKTNQHEEITIQTETQSMSQISEVEMSEERSTVVVDVHKTINLEDKCEDRTEMSENLSTTSSVSQLHDKNKELCHQELDQCRTDGTKDKDISNGSTVELRGADKDDTHENISAEENDKKPEETAANEKTQNIDEGKQEKVGKENTTEC